MRLLAIWLFCTAMVFVMCPCQADTFTNPQTHEVLHGYALAPADGNQTYVVTQESGRKALNMAHWQVSYDRTGRNNKVIIMTLDTDIHLELATKAFEDAICRDVNQGPLFIILQIDSPGGRIDLAERMCTAVMQSNCPVIAYVKGGENGGALSAGAAIALACKKLYMADNTVIGAATPIMYKEGKDGKKPTDLKTALGETVGEKFVSAFRAYFATLAEQNNRPGLLAQAMVDKDTEVIEVAEGGKRLFIDPVNRRPADSVVHTWNKKGSLLTLTADQAVKCTMADKVIKSQQELLSDMKAENAQLSEDNSLQEAQAVFRKVELRFNNLKNSIDLKYKEAKNPQTKPRALKILREVRQDFKTLIKLAKDYPDIHVDVGELEEDLNSVEAALRDVKTRGNR